MTEKQFETAFTAAGAWFFLTEYELIKNWKGQKDTLIDLIFKNDDYHKKLKIKCNYLYLK